MLYSSIIIRISGPMPKPKCRRISTVCSRYSCAVWAGELCFLGTFCSFYSHLSSKTVFSALKLTQSCYYKYEHLFLLKTGNLMINWGSPTNIPFLKDNPHNLTKYEIKWTSKILISQLLSELGKILKYSSSLLFKKPNFPSFS